MLMGLFQRLFGATRDAIAFANFDAGSKAVDISATVLRECIDLGLAGLDGPNRGRLAKPFARGYLSAFSDACIQRLGVPDELESLALITLVHAKIFGRKIGSMHIGDALRDQGNAEFGRGATVGAEDLLRWLNDRTCAPLLLTDYLLEEDAPSSLIEPTDESPAESDVEPRKSPSGHAPSRGNTVLRRKAIVDAAPDKSATIIRLPTRLNTITVKRIERDEH